MPRLLSLQLWCPLILLLSAASPCLAQSSALTESARALERGEYQRAETLAANYLKTRPKHVPARILLARAVLAQGKFQAADAELRRALALDPKNIDALYYLGMVASVLSRMEYERLYQLAPNSERVHQLLGEAALAQNQQTEAESEFLAALQARPQATEVLTALGELKRTQSKFDEAISYYTRAAESGPLTYDVAYGLGACYSYKQDYTKAVAYFRHAVTVAPDAAAAHFALGNALFQLDQTETAITELKAAVTLETRMKEAWFLLGRSYQKQGRQAEARDAFNKVQQLTREEFQQEQRPGQPAATAPRKPEP